VVDHVQAGLAHGRHDSDDLRSAIKAKGAGRVHDVSRVGELGAAVTGDRILGHLGEVDSLPGSARPGLLRGPEDQEDAGYEGTDQD
jgi:hypothetical protein